MTRTHPDPSHPADCFGCKLQGVQFGTIVGAAHTVADRKLDRDLNAYKRMVESGLQPKSTVGAAEIETRATIPFEVETGRIIGNKSLTHRTERVLKDLATV